ncbi:MULTISPECIES: MotA/TolQ/ExbB proton channel family protein [unclassified Paraburkholderia]|uniref:MotA/TolQ/ExbB proton channel family protein n=1 Tax=unclassified Paraburkholderia TaxID=2615204 RepID=UPI002AB1190B|nr:MULTISPECIES: MotA/TolQ/ExbB proton channel family protein [unclassified Paraburkholderia]
MEHYGLANVWQQGDFVTRGTLSALLIMSLTSWTVIILKLRARMRLRRTFRNTERFLSYFEGLDARLDMLNDDDSSCASDPFLALALSGRLATEHHRQTQPQLHDRMDVSDWITRCLKDTLDDIVARLQSGLAILASIGSTAPFVGLFGTVWGIYHALVAIGATGEATIDRVAGPVGESLIMTAFGLFVAIPSVLGYNAIRRSNKGVVTKLNRFAHGLLTYFVTGSSLDR